MVKTEDHPLILSPPPDVYVAMVKVSTLYLRFLCRKKEQPILCKCAIACFQFHYLFFIRMGRFPFVMVSFFLSIFRAEKVFVARFWTVFADEHAPHRASLWAFSLIAFFFTRKLKTEIFFLLKTMEMINLHG